MNGVQTLDDGSLFLRKGFMPSDAKNKLLLPSGVNSAVDEHIASQKIGFYFDGCRFSGGARGFDVGVNLAHGKSEVGVVIPAELCGNFPCCAVAKGEDFFIGKCG